MGRRGEGPKLGCDGHHSCNTGYAIVIGAMTDPRPVAVFDSGVGGLSVWREVVRLLPHESTIYLADAAWCPYGGRPVVQVRRRAEKALEWLVARGVKAVVVACNTASAAALTQLRSRFSLPIVGIEPPIKPAAAITRTGCIVALATPLTARSRRLHGLVARFAGGARVLVQPCPDLVPLVEAGEVDSPRAEHLLRKYMGPALARGADVVALGCTHYTFLLPAIRRVCGPGVETVDPAPAVARQLARVLASEGLENDVGTPRHTFFTTGDPGSLAGALRSLVGVDHAHVERVAIGQVGRGRKGPAPAAHCPPAPWPSGPV